MRFSIPLLTLALTTASCGPPSAGGNVATVDINAAADQAQGSIDTYAANSLEQQVPAPAPAATATTPAVQVAAADSAEGGADVVRHYYALLQARRYDEAWRLWSNDGAASGMTEAAFIASFAPYSDYRATIGVPGDVDAGAGQRYVTVPVDVVATRKGGPAISTAGTVTLHRTGDIDGATAAQRSWHIMAVDVKPEVTKP
ncbi:hypothetical protein BH09PSE4_BH09PSE4_20510 [soil metagenome]